MSNLSATLRAELEKGIRTNGTPDAYVIGSFDFPSGERHYSNNPAVPKAIVEDLGGRVYPFVTKFGDASLGNIDIQSNALTPSTTSATIYDEDDFLIKEIARYPRSLRSIDVRYGVYSLTAIGYEWIYFTGQLKDWEQLGPRKWRLNCATDMVPITSAELPRHKIATIFDNPHDDARDKYLSPIYGVHDSEGVGGEGMISCPCVDLTLHRYFASLGYVVDVPEVFKEEDSVVTEVASGFTITKTIYRGYQMTFIDFDIDQGDAPIYCDVEGLDCDEPEEPVATTTNPLTIGRHFLANYIYNEWKSGDYYGDADGHIHVASWDLMEAYATAREFVGSRKLNTAAQVEGLSEIQSFFESLGMHPYWTSGGLIAVGVLDPTTIEMYTTDRIREDEFFGGHLLRKDSAQGLLRTITLSHMRDDAKGKYNYSTIIKNMGVDERTSLDLDLPWNAASLAT